jgi:hypothetical protein
MCWKGLPDVSADMARLIAADVHEGGEDGAPEGVLDWAELPHLMLVLARGRDAMPQDS